MSFLCMTRDKEVSYHQCINECQYFFKSACIDKMNESYNQALEDCCNVLKQCWLNGTVANRIVKEQIAEIEKLKR